MYQLAHHKEDRLEVQHALIEAHRLGILVTMGRSGLLANPVPFVLDRAIGPNGRLRAHVARANPLWREYDRSIEVLAIFEGSQAYVTPSWYATKEATGKVVPTWNYVTVHAYGTMTIIEDRAWLFSQIEALTKAMEEGRARPWSVADAPDSYIEAQIEQIIGIEIPIDRLEGKWKLSQNRTQSDREGVVAGLRACGDEASATMAELISADLRK